MSIYTEADVKERAVNNFIEMVIAGNKTLGNRLKRNRNCIYSRVVSYIQRIGVHEYAEEVLKRNSGYRSELLYLIREG